MTKTTQTGIPIEYCLPCDRDHPVTHLHCSECRRASIFVTEETGLLCYPCQQLPNQTDIFQQLKEITNDV